MHVFALFHYTDHSLCLWRTHSSFAELLIQLTNILVSVYSSKVSENVPLAKLPNFLSVSIADSRQPHHAWSPHIWTSQIMMSLLVSEGDIGVWAKSNLGWESSCFVDGISQAWQINDACQCWGQVVLTPHLHFWAPMSLRQSFCQVAFLPVGSLFSDTGH